LVIRYFLAVRRVHGAWSSRVLTVPGDRHFSSLFPSPAKLPKWITPTEMDYYIQAFTRSGFRGPLNWYRNIDRNWELSAPWARRGTEGLGG
jgi:hypothetical protein